MGFDEHGPVRIPWSPPRLRRLSSTDVAEGGSVANFTESGHRTDSVSGTTDGIQES